MLNLTDEKRMKMGRWLGKHFEKVFATISFTFLAIRPFCILFLAIRPIIIFFSDGDQAISTCEVALFLKFGYIEFLMVDYI